MVQKKVKEKDEKQNLSVDNLEQENLTTEQENLVNEQENLIANNDNNIQINENEQTNEQKQVKIRKKLDENMLVTVASGVYGRMTYIDGRTGKTWKFEKFGDEHVMELHELRAMLSSARKFLQKGWICVLDPEVIDYLNLERFQQEVVTQEDLETLLESKPEQILEYIENANVNAKRLIYGFAKEKYINGELTNIHTIKAIEQGLGESLDPNS